MDIQNELPAVKASNLTLPPPKESGADVGRRFARTPADLDGREAIARLHIAEAFSYRQRLASF